MIKDLLVSFKDNINEKTRNPFLGTYVVVWIVRNWELLYTVFNFDSDQNLNNKVEFIKGYYKNHEFLNNLLTNILWAFAILITTYALLNITRFITNLFEKQLTPLIYKITDSKSIVLKSEYDRIRTDRDDLQFRLDQERESKTRLENRIKILDEEIVELRNNRVNENESNSQKPESNVNNDISLIINKLKDKDMKKDFIDTAVMINKGDFINNDYKPKDYFIQLGLITYVKDNPHDYSKKYQLTPDGELTFKRISREEI